MSNSEYEKETRKLFFLGPGSFRAWRDMHRAALARLFADPRMTEAAKEAAREML